MDIVQLIAYVIFLAIVGVLLTAFGRSRKTIAMLDRDLKQSKLDYLAAVSRIAELVEEQENKKIEQSDGFVRFLSESRNWAFQYVEDVQSAIAELALSRNDAVKLEVAINKLIDLLPEENKEK